MIYTDHDYMGVPEPLKKIPKEQPLPATDVSKAHGMARRGEKWIRQSLSKSHAMIRAYETSKTVIESFFPTPGYAERKEKNNEKT